MTAAALALVVALFAFPAAAAAAPSAKIRVGDQSAPGDRKVAIVVSGDNRVGDRFRVTRVGGGTVLRGRLTGAGGSPSPWRHAARADLSAVDRPGAYKVRVGRLTSPTWRIGAGVSGAQIRRLLSIFAVNADGAEPNPVFGPAHLNDATAPIVGGPTDGQQIDVAGGWRDAGDAIKFTVTIAMASYLLDTTAQLDPADAARLGEVSDVGIRFLQKAHPVGSQTFISQVGDDSDHGGPTIFRDYADDDASADPAFSRRKAYGDSGSGNLGAAAAALASAALRAGPGTPAGAGLLQAAREWYARGVAVNGPGPALGGFDQPGGNDFSDWQGFMALAAAAMWRATGEEAFLDDAARFLPGARVGAGFSPYYSVGGLAAADLCGGLGRPAVSRDSLRRQACATLRSAVREGRSRAATNAFRSPGGFYFGWVQDHTGSAALEAAADRANAIGGGFLRAYEARDYLLGRNPWGASFVLGPGGREAHHPHHPVTIKGNPSRLGNGFVVGGPSRAQDFRDYGIRPSPNNPYARFNPSYSAYGGKVIYEDRTLDFVTSEVGLAYSSSALLLLGELRR
jgi:hypothetical protein